jgi:hypothetical protein
MGRGIEGDGLATTDEEAVQSDLELDVEREPRKRY